MAKKVANTRTAGALAGQTVAFVGKFGYMLDKYKDAWVKSAGGTIVPATGTFEYLVYGEGRGGKPPGDVAKIEKRVPGVTVFDVAGLARFVLPTAAEFVAAVKRTEPTYEYWSAFQALLHAAGGNFDLSNGDFRGTHLSGAKLGWAVLSGADFRDTNCEYADLATTHAINGAKFDRAKLYAATLRKVKGCSFRGADLKQTWADGATYEACDFRDATMPGVRGARSQFTGCDFRSADLSDADFTGSKFLKGDFSKADLTRVQGYGAQFTDAKFVSAKLHRADLRESSLKGADLRNADLRDAALGGADLTGANVAGADFAGAGLTGATIQGVDFSKAKNFVPPVARVAGPKAKAFAKATTGAKGFTTTAEADLGGNEHAKMCLRVGPHGLRAFASHYRDGAEVYNSIPVPTFLQGLLNLADRWPKATLRLDTVRASGSPTVRGGKLRTLAVAAWAEAFGADQATDAELTDQQKAQAAEALRQRDDLMEQLRDKGASTWHAIDFRERMRYNLRGIDLRGGRLMGLDMARRDDLRDSRFSGANLSGAKLWGSDLHSADFTNANLAGAELQFSKCEKTSFVGANLRNANLNNAKLCGTDLTGAHLEGATFENAQFDEHTLFPVGFKIPENVLWKGEGPRPGPRRAKTAPPGSMDFDAFFKGLTKKVEPARVQKATSMLKAERYQLYADLTDTHLVGVVKSQSDKDLAYSCRLASDGQFYCGTQNLRACGGLHGALCKHLLVLVIGLAKSGTLDPATADNWVSASKDHKPVIDRDAVSETFLKFKGAEAGDIDWRPTETVPEDFYTM
ncbi:pentapeptide repeat-containing protein [Gemmata sp. G18]|uniref:Pentapeptide repeat-containing protein n=1 Tax=Gemmata palustris TaxID=2822762 RepID=A0ABS5BTL6_9BACT|nr:pentapeptide repeat-containing protein [Gemmata palustris]MBP3957034.1 pentapeptide repeat-containing protein [Gemmata palustris]